MPALERFIGATRAAGYLSGFSLFGRRRFYACPTRFGVSQKQCQSPQGGWARPQQMPTKKCPICLRRRFATQPSATAFATRTGTESASGY
jgi:hypothetical protein